MKLLKPFWISHGSLSKDNSVDRPIYSLDIHPDGSRLATGGVIDTCGVVILWNMAPVRNPALESDPSVPRKLFQMDSHQACVNCVRWSPAGRWLASTGMDKVIMIWTKTAAGSRQTTVFGSKEQTKFTEHWRCVSVLRGHSGDVIDLAWSHDGERLASASVDNTVIIWTCQTGAHIPGATQFSMQTTLRGHAGFVKGVAWDPIGRYLASLGDDVAVKVWRTADWQEELNIKKPFAKANGQSQVMRISWSLDGSTLAAPHAINNGFPTVKLISRANWQPTLDLVGHRKHVICARYNPNVLRRKKNGESQDLVCLALGSKDRSVSVWTTNGRRALVVVHDLFTNSVCDLTWSTNGCELLACSLDGTVSYMGFTHVELGTPWSTAELVQMHHKTYGQSLLEKSDPIGLNLLNSISSDPNKPVSIRTQSNIVLETPEALELQLAQAEVRQRLADTCPEKISTPSVKRPASGPSKQIESRSKDGRRRIMPIFLGHLDDAEEDGNSNPQFSSSQSSQSGKSTNRSALDESINSTSIMPAAQVSIQERTDSDNQQSGESIDQTVTPVGHVEKASVAKSEKTKSNAHRNGASPKCTSVTSSAVAKLSSEFVEPKTSTSSPRGTTLVALSSNDATGVEDHGSASDSGISLKRRARIDLDSSVELLDTDANVLPRKKRRVRLFTKADDNSTPSTKKSTTSSNKASTSVNTGAHQSPKQAKPITNATDNATPKLVADTRPESLHIPQSISKAPISTPTQLANQPKVQFICSHPVNGPILIELLAGESNRSTGHRINASRNDKRLWELLTKDKLTAYARTDNLLAVGDCTGHIMLLYSSGGRLCPPLFIDSDVHTLVLSSLSNEPNGIVQENTTTSGSQIGLSRLCAVFSGAKDMTNPSQSMSNPNNLKQCTYRLLALSRSGRLTVWHVTLPVDIIVSSFTCFSPSIFPQFVVETNVNDVLRGSPSAGFLSLSFSPDGNPVLHRKDGSSFLFVLESRTWFELFDGTDTDRCQAALVAARGCPAGPLASCQMLNKVIGQRTGKSKVETTGSAINLSQTSSNDHRILVQNFLEAQTSNANVFGSSSEYRYWLTRWFRHLVEDDEEERLRQICQDLIGPVISGSKTNWQPFIKGLSKRALAKDLLSLFALNLRLQRLYVELRDMLEQCQVEPSPSTS